MRLKSPLISASVALMLCANLYANEVYTIKNMSLKEALEKISKESKLSYIVEESLIEGKNAPNIENIEGIKKVLDIILMKNGLEATIDDETIIIKEISTNNSTALGEVEVLAHDADGSAEDGYLSKKLKQVGIWGAKSLQDTPYSMSVMSSELMENVVAGDMDQIYKMNPLIQNSAPTTVYATPYAAVRGFHSQKGIMDGVSLSATSRGISLEELDRVEMMNGLSGFMYGAGNPGGVTNYVLKRPTYEPLTNFTLGNKGASQYFAHIDLGNKIDNKGEFAYRFNALYQDGETGKENQNIERKLISGAIDWNVNDNLLLQIEAAHTYYRVDAIDSRFYAYANNSYGALDYWIKPLPNDKTYTPDWTYLETETDRIGLNLTYDINKMFTFRSAYIYKRDRQESINLYPAYFADSGYKNGWVSRSAPSFDINQGAYAYLDSEFNTFDIKHKLTIGVSGDILETKKHETSSISGGTSIAFGDPDDLMSWGKPSSLTSSDWGKRYKSAESSNMNILIGDDVTFNEQWSALLGVNSSTIKVENFNLSGKTTSEYDKTEVTPTISILYKPTERVTTYASYIEGLENGTTVSDDATQYNNPGEILDPYVSKQYELGAKYSIYDDLFVSSALYRIEKANSFNERTANGKITVNQDGLQVHEGFELSLTGKVTENLTLIAGGTIIDAKVKKATDSTTEGKRPSGVSSKLAKIYAEYTIPSLNNLTITGGAYYTGEKYKDSLNKQKIDDYTIYDLGARYRTKIDKYPVTFNLNIANLTDKDYWATTYSLGIPRTIAYSMKMEF